VKWLYGLSSIKLEVCSLNQRDILRVLNQCVAHKTPLAVVLKKGYGFIGFYKKHGDDSLSITFNGKEMLFVFEAIVNCYIYSPPRKS
jgi:hypothetical protein